MKFSKILLPTKQIKTNSKTVNGILSNLRTEIHKLFNQFSSSQEYQLFKNSSILNYFYGNLPINLIKLLAADLKIICVTIIKSPIMLQMYSTEWFLLLRETYHSERDQ